jgi:hypothetical protein
MQGEESLGVVERKSEVGLGDLFGSSRNVSNMRHYMVETGTNKINLALSTVLQCEGKGSFQSIVLVAEEKESLVWPFCLAIFCCGQDDLERVCLAEFNWFREGDVIGQSGNTLLAHGIYAQQLTEGIGKHNCNVLVFKSSSNPSSFPIDRDDCFIEIP